MAKKITLELLSEQIASLATTRGKGFGTMDKGFAAIADNIADIKRDMATKEQLIALHTQVNGIEGQLRTMNHVKLVDRVCDLEENVFGQVRA
jgi:hypothetical protein